MVEIHTSGRIFWLLVPSPQVLAYFSGLVFHRDADVRLDYRITAVKVAVMTSLRFFNCVFYDAREYFGLDETSTMEVGIWMYLPSAIVADIDDLSFRTIVWGTPFDAAMYIVAFEHLRDLDRSSIGLFSSIGWRLLRQGDDTVLTSINCLRIEVV